MGDAVEGGHARPETCSTDGLRCPHRGRQNAILGTWGGGGSGEWVLDPDGWEKGRLEADRG